MGHRSLTWPPKPGIPGRLPRPNPSVPIRETGPERGRDLTWAPSAICPVLASFHGVAVVPKGAQLVLVPMPLASRMCPCPRADFAWIRVLPCEGGTRGQASQGMGSDSGPLWLRPPRVASEEEMVPEMGYVLWACRATVFCVPAGPWPWASSTRPWALSLCSAAPSQAWSPSNCASVAITSKLCPVWPRV